MENLVQMKNIGHHHESVHFYKNDAVGLSAIIAIHTTYSDISLGGCRIHSFNSEKEALTDVLRLSEHMTYKSLLCDLNIGGGKSVIMTYGDHKKKTPLLLQAFAQAVNSLDGRYIVSVDMGSDSADMDLLKKNTDYVIGYDDAIGGAGDPGVYTAQGVIAGMRSAAQKKWSSPSLKGRKIVVTGLGNVGKVLCHKLLKEGSHLVISDIEEQRVQEIKNLSANVQAISPKSAHQETCDIFSPCATGDIFNEQVISELNCEVVAGAANNQLSMDSVGQEFFKRDILYLPDFAVNSGGLIGVVTRGLRRKSLDETYRRVNRIEVVIQDIIEESYRKGLPTSQIASDMARKKYEKIYSRQSLL